MKKRAILSLLAIISIALPALAEQPKFIPLPWDTTKSGMDSLVWPGPEFNTLCVRLRQWCLGNVNRESCDFTHDILDRFMDRYPPPEGTGRYWLWKREIDNKGFVPNAIWALKRRWFHEWEFSGCLKYTATDTVEFGDTLILKGSPPLYAEDLRLVWYDYLTDLDTLDLRERMYAVLTTNDTAKDVPDKIMLTLTLTSLTTSDTSFMPVYLDTSKHDTTTQGIRRIWLSSPMDIHLPKNKCSSASLALWIEATDTTSGEIRKIKAKYNNVADSAYVYHNFLRVVLETDSNLTRGDSAALKVKVSPGKIAYDIALYKWAFSPSPNNLDTIEFIYRNEFGQNGEFGSPVLPLRKHGNDIFEASIWAGNVVAKGLVKAEVYFENDPNVTLYDTSAIYIDSVKFEDDVKPYISGFLSNDTLSLNPLSRDWSFDEDKDIDDNYLRVFHSLPACSLSRFPEPDTSYLYLNFVSLKLNPVFDPNEEDNQCPIIWDNPIEDISFNRIPNGPNKDYTYPSSKPFRFKFVRYVHPDLRSGQIQNETKECPEFNVRLGDLTPDDDINYNEMQLELIHALNRDVSYSWPSQAFDSLSGMNDTLQVNPTVEDFIVMWPDSIDDNPEIRTPSFYNALTDSIREIIEPFVDDAIDKAYFIDFEEIERRYSTKEPEWPDIVTGHFNNEVHFVQRWNYMPYFVQKNELTYGDSIMLEILPDSAQGFSDELTAKFKLTSNFGSKTTGDIDWSRVGLDSSAYFWIEENIYDLFSAVSPDTVDSILSYGASLIGTVYDNAIFLEDDTVYFEIPNWNFQVHFADGSDGSYNILPDTAVFWASWDSIWVVVDGLDSLHKPTVTRWHSDDSAGTKANVSVTWNVASAKWRGRTKVRTIIDSEGVKQGSRLRVKATYSGSASFDDIPIFNATVNLKPWWMFGGAVPASSDEAPPTFVANRDYFNKLPYYQDNLVANFSPLNLSPENIKLLFSAPDSIKDSLWCNGALQNPGKADWILLDSVSNSWEISDDLEQNLYFVSQQWYLNVPDSSTGRAYPLEYRVNFYYNPLPAWSSSMAKISFRSSLVKQDSRDMLRQEYFDFIGRVINGIQYILRGAISPPFYADLIADRMPVGMHPGGNHHHYEDTLGTQGNLDQFLDDEIWWNENVTFLMDLIDQFRNAVVRNELGFRSARAWTSGFRCPVRNKNIFLPIPSNNNKQGANNSKHLEGCAVDFQFDLDTNMVINAEIYELSKIYFRFFATYNNEPYESYLYGRRVNRWGEESFRLRPANFEEGDLITFPDPNDPHLWNDGLLYNHPDYGQIRIGYSRAHVGKKLLNH